MIDLDGTERVASVLTGAGREPAAGGVQFQFPQGFNSSRAPTLPTPTRHETDCPDCFVGCLERRGCFPPSFLLLFLGDFWPGVIHFHFSWELRLSHPGVHCALALAAAPAPAAGPAWRPCEAQVLS